MRAEVAPRTAEMYSEFWRCGVCRRVYWEGNTFRQALAHYAQFAEPKKPGAAAEGEVSEILMRKFAFGKGTEVNLKMDQT